MTSIGLYLLGAPRIERDGNLVELDTRKAIALLAYLVVTGEAQWRDSLAALLWPEYDHAHASGALRRTLSSIRKGLGESVIETNRETVFISPICNLWCDYLEFHELIAANRNTGSASLESCEACLAALTGAAKLYRDHFMAGFGLRDSSGFDDWQFFQAEMLRRECSEVLEQLVQAYRDQGDLDSAITYAKRWLSMDPLQEPAHRQLMQLYAWSGQRNSALRQYQECVRILKKELGVPPLEETTRLYQEIKGNRFGTTSGSYQMEANDRPTTFHHARKAEPMTSYGLKGAGRYPFVGRSLESMLLQEDYAKAGQHGHFTVIEGEAGIGKTRLAEEFIDYARDKGAFILTAHCYQGEMGLAYSPFAELLRSAVEQPAGMEVVRRISGQWLSEAARLVPEFSQYIHEITRPFSLESPGAQTRFFEGVSQVLLSICKSLTPGVIFIDDLHWADEASIDLLTYLVRRLQGRPIYLLATWRGEELPHGHRLRQLVYEAKRAGTGMLLPLEPLNREAIGELVRSVLVRDSFPFNDLSERLYRETDGLPFFVLEYLESFANASENDLEQNWTMPGSIRGLLGSRLSPLNDTDWQIIQTAAVMGRSFSFDILKDTSGRSEDEAITALEDLIVRGLVREIQPAEDFLSERLHKSEYDFTHQIIREYVYEETSLARRRILHRRVADYLVSLVREGRGTESLAGVIAQHYRLANLWPEAAEYYRVAGDNARSLYANTEALVHYRSALELGHPNPALLQEVIGDLLTLSGDYVGAQTSYLSALTYHENDSPALSRIEHKLGIVLDRHGEWDLAEGHFLKALESLLETRAPGEASRIYADLSLNAHHRGQPTEALRLARKALEIAAQAGDRPALAQAYNILGILARNGEDYGLALSSFEESLLLAETLNDPAARAAALNNLSLVYNSLGDVEKAIELAQMALKLCTVQGDRHREAALHNNLADLYYLEGQSEQAMAHLKQAVAIFSEIEMSSQNGLKANNYQPEIWKLSEW